MEEIWKDIPNYDGYQASNLGRIRTHNKKTYTLNHGMRTWKDRILVYKNENYSKRNHKQGMGYRVDLWKNGKPKTFLVHRLIATTFLDNLIDTNLTVNHKDGNRYNNNVNNLEWVTREDNIRYGFINGQYSTNRKIKLTNKKTNASTVFNSMSQAGLFLNKNQGFISAILKKGQNSFVFNKIDYLIEIL